MEKIAQGILIVLQIVGFMILVYRDINGRKEQEPSGFRGFVGSVICLAVQLTILYYAGALSHWIKP